jgi:two-component system sensor histidine kinase KdpD
MTAEKAHGAHIIFLGYAVGVGKTRAMLAEAGRLKHSGADVVIGLLDPHGRSEIARLAGDIECLPPLVVDYHGAHLPELDLDGAIARRPDWLLVDELAHSVLPESALLKRWEQVEALRDVGISVMSTLNAQHVESLNGLVYQVTGVRVAETLPDSVLAGADWIELVDLPPEKLLARMRDGLVFPPEEQAAVVRAGFFKPVALAVLRAEARRLKDEHAQAAGRHH